MRLGADGRESIVAYSASVVGRAERDAHVADGDVALIARHLRNRWRRRGELWSRQWGRLVLGDQSFAIAIEFRYMNPETISKINQMKVLLHNVTSR